MRVLKKLGREKDNMSREIKFRVWDIILKKWANPADFIGVNSRGEVICGNEKSNRLTGSVLQQFTGLKDQNGKDIYEGDILNLNLRFPENGVVSFNNGGFIYTGKNMKGTYLGIVISGFGEKLEVVGNIFENPELLA